MGGVIWRQAAARVPVDHEQSRVSVMEIMGSSSHLWSRGVRGSMITMCDGHRRREQTHFIPGTERQTRALRSAPIIRHHFSSATEHCALEKVARLTRQSSVKPSP